MLLNKFIDKAENIVKSLSSASTPVLINNVEYIVSIDLALDNNSKPYVNIITSDSNKTILDKVADYLRNNLERYDDHIGLTKEEFIEELIKNVSK